MERSKEDAVVVHDLRWILGRHTIHCEPDLCGRMNVVLDERSPDRVTFACDTGLVPGQTYTIVSGDDEPLRVKIDGSIDSRYEATVETPAPDTLG